MAQSAEESAAAEESSPEGKAQRPKPCPGKAAQGPAEDSGSGGSGGKERAASQCPGVRYRLEL